MSVMKAVGYGFGGCLGVGIAMVFVGGCLAALGGNAAQREAERANGIQRQSPTDQRSTQGFPTLAKFEQISNGMSLSSVRELIGSPGELLSENTIGAGTQFETHTAMYQWRGSDGISNMNVTIQNGLVMSKAQIGLR